jgi:hypothetical protein
MDSDEEFMSQLSSDDEMLQDSGDDMSGAEGTTRRDLILYHGALQRGTLY